MPAGRPSKLTSEIQQEIFSRLAEGESGLSISRSKHMPSWGTLCRWKRENKEFCTNYVQAHEDGLEKRHEELQEIAGDESRDILEIEKSYQRKDGSIVTMIEKRSDNTAVNRDRLKVDTLKWSLSKLLPKKYGDKIQTEHSGSIEFTELVDRPGNDSFESWQKRVTAQMQAKKQPVQ